MSGTVSLYSDKSAFDGLTSGVNTYAIPSTGPGGTITIGSFTINGDTLSPINDSSYYVDAISQNYLDIHSSNIIISVDGSYSSVYLYIGTEYSQGDSISISVNGTLVSTVTPDGSSAATFIGLTDTVPITNVTLADATHSESEVDLVTSLGAGDAVCHLRGTRILTPTGEVAVEDLKIGDQVVTRFGAMRPIKWIGRQSYKASAIRDDREKIPVRIRSGALGDRLPARDLCVSPGHSMLVDDTLLLAKTLVNGITITQDRTQDEVHYYQVEFATHDCVIAEGTWSESYADAEGLREQFHNVADFHARFPDHRPPEELTLCAPRPKRGTKLDAALRPVVARASAGIAPGALRGFIDRVEGSWKIVGWAQDEGHPELPVLLEVLLGDQAIGTVLACEFRGDLLKAKIGQGRCGFVFRSPVKIAPEAMAKLRVRRAADGAEIRISDDLKSRVSGANVIAFTAATDVEPEVRSA